MYDRFYWKKGERIFCIRRIYALVVNMKMDVETALRLALEKSDNGEYRYCNNPTMIPVVEMNRLRDHAQAVIDCKGDEKKALQMSFPLGIVESPGGIHAGL